MLLQIVIYLTNLRSLLKVYFCEKKNIAQLLLELQEIIRSKHFDSERF